ncbi:cytochrome P450 [Nonomuraea spiralis]|uniref:Cytochrome P450 n=1 Tax=Nonomuraea spiralis TaxID=46182 RepID=A0ABV5IUD6_9ACTN|nr:cytochrome P450 [Nonomuraea spiralis]GGS91103.1 cytochrome P450 [Nonomuraea spiralis]
MRDLADPGLFEAGGQYEAWRWWREHDPVHRHERGFWSVTRYADVDRVLRDHPSFAGERGTSPGHADPAAGREPAATGPTGPDRARAALRKVMGMRPAGSYEPSLIAAITGLLAPGLDEQSFDLAAAVRGLPLALAGPLLGLPRADWPYLSGLAMAAGAEDDPGHRIGDAAPGTPRRAHRELSAYFLPLVRERARTPGEDLVSLMVSDAGGRMDPETAVAGCRDLLLGASVTLPDAASSTVYELARTGSYRAWADRPDLLRTGVEEALRWASPGSHFMRHTTRPVRLSGVDVPAGEPVVAWIGSANRDAAVFPDPDAFDPERTPNRHLAFGDEPYHCAGSHLARLTLRLFFATLFATFADVAVAAEPVRVRSTFLTGFKELIISGTPRRGR